MKRQLGVGSGARVRFGEGSLHYARHFGLLSLAAGALSASVGWRASAGYVASFGLYGALHAIALVACLRAEAPLWRKLLFIAIGASLSMSSVMIGGYGVHFVGRLPGFAGPLLLVAFASGFGAATYALAVRRFWINDLAPRALIAISLGCMLTTVAALIEGRLQAAGGLWIAIIWWFAFSAGVWYHDTLG